MTDPSTLMAADGAVPRLGHNYTRMDMHRDFIRVFQTDEGRRVLGHLLAWCALTSSADGTDRMTASECAVFHEGQRAVGLRLLLQLDRIDGKEDEKVIYGGNRRS